ncbi:hypothetical protein NLX71_24110 [Paenibacillus sp. MZ04-78.2]|uniref:hypothetical protein n=1 Tax=Paenibacillus sp. MZ04-78.2 TaxID=2962034 RepID=UPI0020B85A40|nr:hypothetical protein [Paenibacillus sp. MZ04-78.2]MCP3776345.1 hypothetical protein [Paenibacillus sp. MZ04-78.2]
MSTQVVWVVLAILTSLTFKGISYAFTIPAVISLALILPILFKLNWAQSIYRYVVVAGWTVTSTLLIAPLLYMIYVAKTLSILPIIAIFTALVAFPIAAVVMWLNREASCSRTL